MRRTLRFAVRNPLRVLFLALVLAGIGVWSATRLSIDAVPDLTDVQVQINTAVPGLGPMDVERQVTFPIERAMSGIPGLRQTRSISRFALSQVTLVFEDDADIYRARQLVAERLAQARDELPRDLGDPSLGPIATGLGEIYLWSVRALGPKPDGTAYTSTELRALQDWVIKPQIRTVPGVNEVNTAGGHEKQYLVLPDPERLAAFGLSFRQVLAGLEQNNANAGGSFVEHNGEQYLVRATGIVRTIDDVRDVVLTAHDGVPVYVKDVAEVTVGNELRTGAATENGAEAVIGTAIMLVGENSRMVSQRIDRRLAEVNQTLPANVEAHPIYDRTDLVDATLRTVRDNLLEGAVLVVAVLLVLLGNIRAALIVALAIPLAMLFVVTGMVQTHTSANLLSLGAIDFGLVVDGAVVMAENVLRCLGHEQRTRGRTLGVRERASVVLAAAQEVARPTLYGVGIIMIVYLPVLTLQGIEGKMFRPMATVMLLALAGALVLAFTLVPALCALTLGGAVRETETAFMRAARAIYSPALRFALAHRASIVALALAAVGGSAFLATRLGSEFVPRLREGAFAVEVRRMPSVSVSSSVEMQEYLEKQLLARFPHEIADVFARIGTAEITTDPMGPDTADAYIMLRPRESWSEDIGYEDLARRMEAVLEENPGDTYEFSQPIELRVNELVAGVRSDLAVKVFGDDLDLLHETSRRIAAVLQQVPGAADVKVEASAGLPLLSIDVDRVAIARYGLNVSDVLEVVEIALGGRCAGEVFEGDARFDLVVRLPEALRSDIEQIRRLPIPMPAVSDDGLAYPAMHPETSAYVPLAAVARISVVEGANMVNREDGKRRVVVTCNARDRDLGSMVADAQRRIGRAVVLPPGTWLGWGGQFENLIAGRERLEVVVPLALGLIFVLLCSAFSSVRLALLVFTSVPLALTGGVAALALRGMPFSITAGIGFIALSGVAVLNGLMIVSFIRSLRARGLGVEDAVLEGSLARLRPVLMTGLVASLGFLPMAMATSMGAEVQRPLATVVIGGLVSSTLLTLLVLPTLYAVFDGHGRAQVKTAE